jgi:hypothetical protein
MIRRMRFRCSNEHRPGNVYESCQALHLCILSVTCPRHFQELVTSVQGFSTDHTRILRSLPCRELDFLLGSSPDSIHACTKGFFGDVRRSGYSSFPLHTLFAVSCCTAIDIRSGQLLSCHCTTCVVESSVLRPGRGDRCSRLSAAVL